MCFFKCIKDFFKKVKDEIIRINQANDENAVNVWQYVEEEFEGDPDFAELLQDDAEVNNATAQSQAEAAAEIEVGVTTTIDISNQKEILMIDKDNKIVDSFDNIKEILAKYQGFTYSGIYGCLKGRRQTYKGYLFRNKADYQKLLNTQE